jgi:di/tricarboxylate transporter
MAEQLRRLTASGRCLVAGIVVAAGVPIVAWSMIGDQSEVAETVPNPDYAIRPWNVPAPVSRFIEAGALVALVAAVAFLLYATATRRMRARWWWIVAMAGAIGGLIGLLARTGTARVIGANIGFGIAVLLSLAVAAILICISVVLTLLWSRDSAPRVPAGDE